MLVAAHRDSYRDGSVAGEPCREPCFIPQIDALSGQGSKQGAWQRQLPLGSLPPRPRNNAARPVQTCCITATFGGHALHRDMQGIHEQSRCSLPLPTEAGMISCSPY